MDFYTLKVDESKLKEITEKSLPTKKQLKEREMSFEKIWKVNLIEALFISAGIPFTKGPYGYFKVLGIINFYSTTERYYLIHSKDKKVYSGFEKLLIYIKENIIENINFEDDIIKFD